MVDIETKEQYRNKFKRNTSIILYLVGVVCVLIATVFILNIPKGIDFSIADRVEYIVTPVMFIITGFVLMVLGIGFFE